MALVYSQCDDPVISCYIGPAMDCKIEYLVKSMTFKFCFSDYSCKTNEIVIDKSSPKWYHYFLCGYKGIVDHLSLETPVGMDIMLDGSVPRSAGLSSSSALVCCAAMTTAKCNDTVITKVL